MDQGWAAVIAAGVAGAVAVAGSFIGVWVGRWQARDQARIEHGQWLRGQRQEAFVSLLTLWDEAVLKLEQRVLSGDDLTELEGLARADNLAYDEVADDVIEQMRAEIAPVLLAGERVTLLGPAPVEQAAANLLSALQDIAAGIGMQYVEPGTDPHNAYRAAEAAATERRKEFLAESSKLLQTAPDVRRS
ncbi:hypothetical protein ACFWRZ_08845 [Streptomyces rubiginosohelvolus]|uniref:hypothetical protein n=1 Tax=Streptomyces rubiginosohelvolus TaxID=67362 RepID=UPI003649E558